VLAGSLESKQDITVRANQFQHKWPAPVSLKEERDEFEG
jgi:hypothetical protein